MYSPTELLDSDFGNIHSFYDKLEDFDSGCSCLPSSPSNCSEFSYSSLDNLGEDWTIRRKDAIEMGRSLLEGGPVINPFINIKAENDIDVYDKQTTLLMPDNFPDLLDNAVATDHCLVDLDENETFSVDKGIIETDLNTAPNIVNAVQKCLPPEPTVKEQTRKMNYSESDHTYAGTHIKQKQLKNVPVKQQKLATSNLKGPKDDKYWEKRQKNNLAAKRSRQIKRNREIELVKKSNLLEKENADLLKQMEKLKKLVRKLELKLER